ncbi:aspartyl protease AED3-like [Vicia villosa]|uniref:aspartyl protease AED3-like n=1 Tax=Vicia villosa TaxID=3911 RepID=UPI00273BDC98|nr:aspartyl protease AED3-like [Vicia villosa]
MSTKLATIFILCYVFHICKSNSIDPCPSQQDDSDLKVFPMYGKCSPINPPKTMSWDDRVINMASKDFDRVNFLSKLIAKQPTSSASAPIAPGQNFNINNYVVRVKIGTPGQLLFIVLDTSTDEAFVPSSDCTGCSATKFSPKSSTSYVPLNCSSLQCSQARGRSCSLTGSDVCSFNQSYADSSFSATLAQDSVTLDGNVIIPNFSFGSINAISGASIPAQGLLGLGRGPLSLLSQTMSTFSGVFSYCLPSFKSHYFSGSLKLGPVDQPQTIRTTPLLSNPRRPSLYYINLTGISVGSVNVPIPNNLLAFDPKTGAGSIIDSGTVITRFVEPVYNATRDEFRKQVKGPFSSLGAYDTCFPETSETTAPAITLHFQDLDLKLPLENGLIHSTSEPLICLAMAAAPRNVDSVLNVIANYQQQNLRILFDTVNNKVGIARELCN